VLLAALNDLGNVLLPLRCAGCGARGAPACLGCLRSMRAAPQLPPPPPVDAWTSCFVYEGVTRELIARAKYRNERAVLGSLGRVLAAAISSSLPPFDVMTWAPASRARFASTGVDHGRLLARAASCELGLPAEALLRRPRDLPQTGRAAVDRRRGPNLRAMHRVNGRTILVIDDVATTGGTLAAAARALRTAGATSVFAATLARTPRPGERSPNRSYTSGPQRAGR
jgi:predicted amidophosphoribosyltransferase